jgi:2,4-dienoyl-CoA reductase-like NADH-dependent reductase (Old Yellow Enzyme family)
MTDVLFQPGTIGALKVTNRLLRAGTSESMATVDDGEVTDGLIELYRRLAANSVGAIITGHMFTHPRGRYARGQTGIHRDEQVGGLQRLTDEVHAEGAPILAQLAHAGSQSRVPGNRPVAPSPVPNPLTGAEVEEAGEDDISEAVDAFASAARRAVHAGFDGIHIHGANGYLLSEFASPVTNRRGDAWGGSPERRDRLPLVIVEEVRSAVPQGFPVTMKMGLVDAVPGGVDLTESVRRAAVLVAAGVDAIEVSSGLMQAPTDSAKAYVAVDRRRALGDLLFHRILAKPTPEAYFRDWARALRAGVETTVILVGGLRTTETMRDVLTSGDADFLAMARPLIREPDIVRQIESGREGHVACTSCNLCLMHEGHHSLRCWRVPRRRLLEHAAYRISGGFAAADVIPVQRPH